MSADDDDKDIRATQIEAYTWKPGVSIDYAALGLEERPEPATLISATPIGGSIPAPKHGISSAEDTIVVCDFSSVPSTIPRDSKEFWEPPGEWNELDARDVWARQMQLALDRSILDLVVVAWQRHDQNGQTDTENEWAQLNLATALCTLPKSLLRAVIDGRVHRAYLTNQEIQDFLKLNLEEHSNQPGLYYQEFSDDAGNPPSCSDATKILDLLEMYCRDNLDAQEQKIVASIDDRVPLAGAVPLGRRRYLIDKSGSNVPVRGRCHKIRGYVRENRPRIAARSSDPKARLAACWTEVGYAATPSRRFTEHRQHRSSNFIMNLVERIITTCLSRKYTLRQFIILPLFRSQDASVGEKLLTIISSACYWLGGGGFVHYTAGLSNASAAKLADQVWTEIADKVWRGSFFYHNFETLRESMDRRTRYLKLKENIEGMQQSLKALKQRGRDEKELAIEIRKKQKVQSILLEKWTGREVHMSVGSRPLSFLFIWSCSERSY